MKILAIETSCDETAIAVIECYGSKKKPEILVLSNLVSSQVALHAKFGGVVPNLAKREHQRNLVPLLLRALNESSIFESGIRNQKSAIKNNPSKNRKNSGITSRDSLFTIHNSILQREPSLLKQFEKKVISLPVPTIDAIATTYGPGLAPALWVGVNFARALALLWNKPLIPVNHMEGHLYSALLISHEVGEIQPRKKFYKFTFHKIEFPALALLVSGGHTELVLVKEFGKYEIIGETLDDAAGEAFDKVARLLGLEYPGGPAISAIAETAKFKYLNSKILKYKFPRPMLNSKNYNFSFSGLKTAVFYLVRDINNLRKVKKLRPAIAKEFQDAVVDVLVSKTIRAAKEYKVKTVLLGGGVAANNLLRETLRRELHTELPEIVCWLPEAALTGDNALMIAFAAYLSGKKKAPTNIRVEANLRLG